MAAQHLEAMERAQEVRKVRAELKRQIKRGEVSVAEVIEPHREIPSELGSMPIGQLLSAQKGWRDATTRRHLTRLVISELRRLDALTDRQRGNLVRALRGEAVDDRLLTA